MTTPFVDDTVKHVGSSYLRTLNAETLKSLEGPVVVQVNDQPAAVIVPYAQYLELQKTFWPSSLFELIDKTLVLVGAGKLVEDLKTFEWTPAKDEEPPAKSGPLELSIGQRCAHCGKVYPTRPGSTSLCSECFKDGHRSGPTCLRCEELGNTNARV